MLWNPLGYAVACVIVPVVWGLGVSYILNRFQKRKADEDTSSSIDLHERS